MSSLIATSQHIVIIGLGVTGISVARYLTREGKTFSVVDSSLSAQALTGFKQEFPEVHVVEGPLDYAQWGAVSQIILSPGVARDTPAVAAAIAAGIEVIGDIELFVRAATAPIVAITGSNGKTTVTTLVGQMASCAGVKVGVGGNVGVPALDILSDDVELYVLELSSFQLESIELLNAEVATVLNVSPDHMDRYKDLHEYMRTKQRIYFGAATSVCNRDDPLTQPPVAADRRYVSFGSSAPDLKQWGLTREGETTFITKGLEKLLNLEAIKLRGTHNALNALAALAIGEAVSLPMAAMLNALKSYQGLAHRCEFITTIGEVHFYNDSKATNVGAAIAAVEGLASAKNIILIAGGDGKGADFSALKGVARQHIKALVTIGADGEKIAAVCGDYCAVSSASNLRDAIKRCQQLAAPGDVVLLSPACASFDMFKSYQDRGQQFRQCVESLCA